MKVKITVTLLVLLTQSSIVYSSEELIQTPCQRGVILTQPHIKQLSNNTYGIHFVRTWGGDYAPYVLITESHNTYEAKILGQGTGNKYAGYILVNSKDVKAISFEGCLIDWRIYHENN